MVLSLLLSIAKRLTPVSFVVVDVPHLPEEDVDVSMYFWLGAAVVWLCDPVTWLYQAGTYS